MVAPALFTPNDRWDDDLDAPHLPMPYCTTFIFLRGLGHLTPTPHPPVTAERSPATCGRWNGVVDVSPERCRTVAGCLRRCLGSYDTTRMPFPRRSERLVWLMVANAYTGWTVLYTHTFTPNTCHCAAWYACHPPPYITWPTSLLLLTLFYTGALLNYSAALRTPLPRFPPQRPHAYQTATAFLFGVNYHIPEFADDMPPPPPFCRMILGFCMNTLVGWNMWPPPWLVSFLSNTVSFWCCWTGGWCIVVVLFLAHLHVRAARHNRDDGVAVTFYTLRCVITAARFYTTRDTLHPSHSTALPHHAPRYRTPPLHTCRPSPRDAIVSMGVVDVDLARPQPSGTAQHSPSSVLTREPVSPDYRVFI